MESLVGMFSQAVSPSAGPVWRSPAGWLVSLLLETWLKEESIKWYIKWSPSPLTPLSCSVPYASEMCDVLNQDLFSACHEHLSPTAFHQQCRSDTCKCGTPCLCSALAHYARHCRRFSIVIDFRTHVRECGEWWSRWLSALLTHFHVCQHDWFVPRYTNHNLSTCFHLSILCVFVMIRHKWWCCSSKHQNIQMTWCCQFYTLK